MRNRFQLRKSYAEIVCVLLLCCCFSQPVMSAESQWVKTGVTGRLVYVPDAEGDRILDFSAVGYRGRGAALIPSNVPTSVTVSPVAGDDTSSIQAAINQVSALPLGPDGYRGAVLLQAGDYDINGQLQINTSGVVLRGVGRGTNETVLHARGTGQRSLIEVTGSGSQSLTGSTRNMVDKVVPVGSRSFRVDSTSGFTVGDTVRVTRPTPANWISDLGMDMIPPRSDGGTVNQWTESNPETIKLRYDRVVTRIEGDRVFVDAPLPQSFDQAYGGGTIQRYTWSNRINNVGIENLRGESDFISLTDEDHGWEFISIDSAQDVWVQNILSKYFGDSSVVANPGSKRVTVDNAINESPVSVVTGGRRYTFDLSGELGLVTNSEANEGRHDFVNNSTQPRGPNVFHNSVAHTALDEAGPHQRWATGTLFDNITVDGDQINARNRGNFGTGHGWAGANMVIWNSTADSFIVQNPPTAQNWLVGSTGNIIEDTTFGPQPSGNYDSHGTPVTTGGTTSLYEAQVNDSQDIEEFHALAGDGNWASASTWNQQVAPNDTYTVSLRDYLIGDVDGFVHDGNGSVDDVFVDSAWESDILSTSAHPITGFDDLSGNKNVAFTIQHVLDSGEQVVHGTLALGLRQGGGLVDTDFVRLFDMDPEHKLNFSDIGWDLQINNTDTFVGVLDLGAFLEEMQSGNVNVQINDDTGLDWAIYTVTVATPRNDTSGTSVFIDGGGTITVDSAISPVGELNLGSAGSGTLLVSDSGLVDVDGDFLQTATGTLEIEIAGDSMGQFGRIDVLDEAMLDGILDVSLDGLFTPEAGDEFEILSASTLSGTFDTINLPELADGLAWDVEYQASSVLLSVLFSADFNGDGLVDGSDLADWHTGHGSLAASREDGDANGDNDVDGHDFLAWQRQAGSSSLPSAVVGIPEPTAVFLALSSAVFMLACGTRAKR